MYLKFSTQTNVNHGVRGSASSVLTATGFVNGKWQFSTPYTESTSHNRSPQNLSQVITSATHAAVPNMVNIRGGLLGEWVKYSQPQD